MSVPTEAAKAAALLFCAALVQVTLLSSFDVSGGTADVVVVTLVAVALLRGAIFGAVGGFFAGLVVDTATLDTLGVTSLLLTLVGYWIGRYAETSRERRPQALLAAVGVVTILYAFAGLGLRVLLGDPVSARLVLVEALLPQIVFNLFLAVPVYALCRRVLRPQERVDPLQEVRLLG